MDQGIAMHWLRFAIPYQRIEDSQAARLAIRDRLPTGRRQAAGMRVSGL